MTIKDEHCNIVCDTVINIKSKANEIVNLGISIFRRQLE